MPAKKTKKGANRLRLPHMPKEKPALDYIVRAIHLCRIALPNHPGMRHMQKLLLDTEDATRSYQRGQLSSWQLDNLRTRMDIFESEKALAESSNKKPVGKSKSKDSRTKSVSGGSSEGSLLFPNTKSAQPTGSSGGSGEIRYSPGFESSIRRGFFFKQLSALVANHYRNAILARPVR